MTEVLITLCSLLVQAEIDAERRIKILLDKVTDPHLRGRYKPHEKLEQATAHLYTVRNLKHILQAFREDRLNKGD